MARHFRWVVAVILAIAAAGGDRAAAAEPHAIAVRGSVSDAVGVPIVGQAVRLLKSRSLVELHGLKSRDQHVEELRVTTDEHGFFEFEFPVDAAFPYYYLRFYDPKTFDAVKYLLPEDQDISRQVKKGRRIQSTVALKTHPDWPQVQELVDQYGPGSHTGQIVRSLGLPSKRTPQGPGRELWTFEKAGVAYLVEGAKVLETHRLPGTTPAGDSAGAEPVIPAAQEDRP